MNFWCVRCSSTSSSVAGEATRESHDLDNCWVFQTLDVAIPSEDFSLGESGHRLILCVASFSRAVTPKSLLALGTERRLPLRNEDTLCSSWALSIHDQILAVRTFYGHTSQYTLSPNPLRSLSPPGGCPCGAARRVAYRSPTLWSCVFRTFCSIYIIPHYSSRPLVIL